ncbi:GNAT family N-acetyltransferase [Rhodococcus sp. CX]|uniref:GNAT family N-acetyltransferase n=1 Tax=Rhodococcus sp. CX TaxID=2789880 RepID=UPI0018CC993C|nr:GNAT family N-acetyltransferase [Rhodococcus sp. CX]MBH0123011.1 GNAT family N-acetyltransferase [Rhodococcus sp. CX]
MPEIRVLDTEPDLIASSNLFRTAMVGLPAVPPYEPGQIRELLEPGRTLGAFVDGVMVGTADSATSGLILPGGRRVPHAAVTHVGVLPTHTRRGVLTALMRHQLHDARDRGEVVATLRASEATIYGRFGYGVASTSHTLELDVRRARLLPSVAGGGPVRLLEPGAVWDVLPRIVDTHPSTRPGTIDRIPLWWRGRELMAQAGSGPNYVAVHGDPGSEDGFVRYRPIGTDRWFGGRDRTVVVDDFYAPTRTAYLGLLRFLLALDLVDILVFSAVPEDDPLPWLLTDRRAVRLRSADDETWLRILDVPAALDHRVFDGDAAVRIGVVDELLPENTGTYRIAATGSCRTDAAPQVEVEVATLAAALLGGTRWHRLDRAGLVRVHDDSALPQLERLFATTEAPFAGVMF